MKTVSQVQASQLLHNKFVVVLGDSIQRSVYKDLVLLLQRDRYLTLSQLKSKGEMSFEQDCLVEGGKMGYMTNGTEYREVRQYRSDHHLVRFYFLTRVYSRYMESILADFKYGLKPDIIIVNSCVWDVSRYSRKWVSEYKENLSKFFAQLKSILPDDCLILWNMTMPLGKKIIGGFLVPEIEFMGPTLRYDVVEANFYGAALAGAYGLDVLDLHFQFRFSLQHRMKDGVHWNAAAHRRITCLLLEHSAQAWGVELPAPQTPAVPYENIGQQSLPCSGQKKRTPKQAQAEWKSDLWDPVRYGVPWMDPARYGGPCGNGRQDNLHMESSATNSTVPAYHYGQQVENYDGFGPHFCEDRLPTHPQFAASYFSFHNGLAMQASRSGGNYSYRATSNPAPTPAAPCWPGNHYVMKKKHTKRQYNPYSRQRPDPYSRQRPDPYYRY